MELKSKLMVGVVSPRETKGERRKLTKTFFPNQSSRTKL